MEKVVMPYEMECMKMVMLKHEETFKQQVFELHRLYHTQRMLMKNMQNQETWNMKNGTIGFEYKNDYTFNKLQTQDFVHPSSNDYDSKENGILEIEDECDIELTLAPTCYTSRKNRSKLRTELNSDSMASFSSSSTGSSLKNRVTIEQNFDRSLNQPLWLCQVLI